VLAAWLVVVVGVLAGVVFAHSVQCADGMTAMAVEQAASSSMVVHASQDGTVPPMMAGDEDHSPDVVTVGDSAHQVTAVPVAAGVLAFGGDRSSGSHDLGGMLAACLVCVVAVAAVIVALRPSPLRIIVTVLTSLRGCRMIHIASPPAPSLAELCLLRT
jgi:hypothetical protein